METAAASAAVRSWAAHNKREVDRAGQRQLESVAEQLEWTEGAAGKFEWELFPALVAAVGDDVKVLCAGELSIPGVRCASVRLRAECRCHQDDGETEIASRYLHLSRRRVATGAKVSAGQRIGDCGGTGQSTSPHLHFEVMVNEQPVRPFRYASPVLSPSVPDALAAGRYGYGPIP